MLIAVIWAIGALIGLAVGAWKGRPILGFFLGGFLGFIGWFIVAVMPKADLDEPGFRRALVDSSNAPKRQCPNCGALVQRAGIVCPRCHADIALPLDSLQPLLPPVEPSTN
jgi:hypothetical protein